jgi:hypothetical protein
MMHIVIRVDCVESRFLQSSHLPHFRQWCGQARATIAGDKDCTKNRSEVPLATLELLECSRFSVRRCSFVMAVTSFHYCSSFITVAGFSAQSFLASRTILWAIKFLSSDCLTFRMFPDEGRYSYFITIISFHSCSSLITAKSFLSVHFFLASRTILTAMNYLRASCSSVLSFRSLCDLPRARDCLEHTAPFQCCLPKHLPFSASKCLLTETATVIGRSQITESGWAMKNVEAVPKLVVLIPLSWQTLAHFITCL